MTETVLTDQEQPYVLPSASQQYYDPAVELTSRNLLASYFGTPDMPGLISQQIPIPIQQVAGLSPLEIQARNMAQGLGGFGGQLAEAERMYRQSGQAFDPRTAGIYGDPQARALYMQSIGAYDPSMGQQFLDAEGRSMMRGASQELGDLSREIPGQINLAQADMREGEDLIRQGAASSADEAAIAQRMALDSARMAGSESRTGQADIRSAASGIGSQVGTAQQRALDAATRARAQTAQAGRELKSAGESSRKYAQEGIAALKGTGAQFDPSTIDRFMDPYTQNVIDAEQAEIERLGNKQRQQAKSQAVQSGAFGGSRGGIEQAEIGRNILQQQAKTGAQLRSQGYQQAAQQAQQSFEQAQGRQQNLGQLTSSLGQAGAATRLQAAQAAGNLGLSAEELAKSGAFQGGQLGMTSKLNEAQLSKQAADMGISTAELQARLGQQAFSTAQSQGQAGMQAGRDIGSSAAQRGQLGMQGIGAQIGAAGQRADIGQGMASQYGQAQQMGMGSYEDQMRRMQGAASGMFGQTQQQYGTALNAYGASGSAQRGGAAGIAGLGQQGYNMLTGQIETMAGLGQTGRGIQDRAYGNQYTAATQMADEPYMRLQRGQQMLGGLAGYLPTYSSGYGTQSNQVGAYQDPSTAAKIGGYLGLAGQGLDLYTQYRNRNNPQGG